MPMTPRDTARMVAPARFANSSPRSGTSLRKNFLTASTIEGAGAKRNPATIMPTKNLRVPIGRCKIPELIDVIADQRPAFHRHRRRGKRQGRQVNSFGNHSKAFDEAQSEPGCRSDHDQQAENGDEDGSQSPAPAKSQRHPLERRIKRHGQHRAPNDDRDKGTDEDQRPIKHEAKCPDADRQFDERRRKLITAGGVGLRVAHWCFPRDTLRPEKPGVTVNREQASLAAAAGRREAPQISQ